jgi:phage-related protein
MFLGVYMPRTETIIYKEVDGRVPLLEWMDELPRKVQDKWTERFEDLREYGHELRRPICEYLRDKIYELRVKRGRVNYRILYSFVGENVVLLSHGCFKIKEMPPVEIDKAISRRNAYLKNPKAHTYIER